MRKQFLTIIALVLTGLSAAGADVIYVDCLGPNDPGSGTIEDPYRRIQTGIDAAVNGDIVQIGPGDYTGVGNHDLDTNGKSINICSSDPNDPEIINRTIINPNGTGRGFYIHSGEDANCIISGLTIKNGYIYGNEGAGIYCSSSEPTIANCIFTDNYAEFGYGGAISCKDSGSLIKNCVVIGNSAYDGGGIECWDRSNIRLINCVISNNRSVGNGGGVDCYYQSVIELTNCSLINNISEPNGNSRGGSVSLLSSSSAIIKNSIFWSNDANTGAQIYMERSSVSLSYCDIQGGIEDVCASYSDLNWGSGNIDSDPCFATFDPNGDPNLWDFHLKSEYGRWAVVFSPVDLIQDGFIDFQDFTALAEVWLQEAEGLAGDLDDNGIVDLLDLEIMLEAYLTAQPQQGTWIQDDTSSPCINAGDPESDWSAEPWPNGKRINMGAFGGTNQASKKGLETDFDADGDVDFNDFSYLASNWGLEQTCIEDLDGNGVVDIEDLGEFCFSWLEQN